MIKKTMGNNEILMHIDAGTNGGSQDILLDDSFSAVTIRVRQFNVGNGSSNNSVIDTLDIDIFKDGLITPFSCKIVEGSTNFNSMQYDSWQFQAADLVNLFKDRKWIAFVTSNFDSVDGLIRMSSISQFDESKPHSAKIFDWNHRDLASNYSDYPLKYAIYYHFINPRQLLRIRKFEIEDPTVFDNSEFEMTFRVNTANGIMNLVFNQSSNNEIYDDILMQLAECHWESPCDSFEFKINL